MQKCDFVQVEDSETDKTMEKLKVIKKQVTTLNNVIKNTKKVVKNLVNNSAQLNLDFLENEQKLLKTEMTQNFEKSSKLITKIKNKLDIRE